MLSERSLDDVICGICGTVGQVYFGDGNEKNCCSIDAVSSLLKNVLFAMFTVKRYSGWQSFYIIMIPFNINMCSATAGFGLNFCRICIGS